MTDKQAGLVVVQNNGMDLSYQSKLRISSYQMLCFIL